jgi:hypothetical protein
MSNASVRSWHEATGFERGTYATTIEGTADMRPRVPYDCRYPTAVREGTPADRPPPSMNCNGDDGRRHLDRAIDAISERRLVDPLRLSILRGLSNTEANFQYHIQDGARSLPERPNSSIASVNTCAFVLPRITLATRAAWRSLLARARASNPIISFCGGRPRRLSHVARCRQDPACSNLPPVTKRRAHGVAFPVSVSARSYREGKQETGVMILH